MHMDAAVVRYISQLTETIHEVTYPRPRGPDFLGERILRYLAKDRLRFFGAVAVVRQEQQHTRQPAFGRVEKLVGQVGFDLICSFQQVTHERAREVLIARE